MGILPVPMETDLIFSLAEARSRRESISYLYGILRKKIFSIIAGLFSLLLRILSITSRVLVISARGLDSVPSFGYASVISRNLFAHI
jgi:hypothetical protein